MTGKIDIFLFDEDSFASTYGFSITEAGCFQMMIFVGDEYVASVRYDGTWERLPGVGRWQVERESSWYLAGE